jgi:hypothetical protein
MGERPGCFCGGRGYYVEIIGSDSDIWNLDTGEAYCSCDAGNRLRARDAGLPFEAKQQRVASDELPLDARHPPARKAPTEGPP